MTVPVSFVRITRWNAWANNQVLEALRAAGGEPERAVAAFEHLLAAELTWLDRMDGDETAFYAVPAIWTSSSMARCEEWFARSSARLEKLQVQLASGYEEQTFPYKNSTGTAFVNRVDDVLTHLYMHSSQYRGEALGLLAAAGHPVPDIDLIFWARITGE